MTTKPTTMWEMVYCWNVFITTNVGLEKTILKKKKLQQGTYFPEISLLLWESGGR